MLRGKRVILLVTGGIAAYKTVDLVRLLKAEGALVRCVMTAAAKEFIGALTLQAVSGEQVHDSLLDPEAEGGMGHIALARWANLVLVAPATADFLAGMAIGLARDLAGTLCLATEAPVAVAPAMNRIMWSHPAIRRSISQLLADGVLVWGPDHGIQACGETGPGRMLEARDLVTRIKSLLGISRKRLVGRKMVVTAGPTREAVDPVRFISNHSSGKQGYALAAAGVAEGADVALISGPVSLTPPPGVRCMQVESAEQMLAVALRESADADLFIGVAAVADFRVRAPAERKIKKQDKPPFRLELIPNPDIIASIAARSRPPYMVGFAAETHDILENAEHKLFAKGIDMVVANDVSRSDIGFDSSHNEVIVITPKWRTSLSRNTKSEVARLLLDLICPAILDRLPTARQAQDESEPCAI